LLHAYIQFVRKFSSNGFDNVPDSENPARVRVGPRQKTDSICFRRNGHDNGPEHMIRATEPAKSCFSASGRIQKKKINALRQCCPTDTYVYIIIRRVVVVVQTSESDAQVRYRSRRTHSNRSDPNGAIFRCRFGRIVPNNSIETVRREKLNRNDNCTRIAMNFEREKRNKVRFVDNQW